MDQGVELPHYNHLLVGVDGSAASDFAVLQSIRYALFDRSVLTLMTVTRAPSTYASVSGFSPQHLAQQATQQAEDRLRRLADQAPGSLTVRTVVRCGHATDELLAAVEEFRADAVCVGSRGRTRVGSALLGSVASELMRRSPVAVVVLHPPHQPEVS